MVIEKMFNGIRYTLSNENLKVNDEVFPIASGRCLDNGGWILHDFSFEDYSTGFPDEPHRILKLKHSDYKPYEVRTNHGYSPIERYYKIIKKEEKIVEYNGDNSVLKIATRNEWVELTI
jgi:hypothetical protein